MKKRSTLNTQLSTFICTFAPKETTFALTNYMKPSTLDTKSTTLDHIIYCFTIAVLTLFSCHTRQNPLEPSAQVILEEGCYPHATLWQGCYYYTMQQPDADCVVLYAADQLEHLAQGRRHVVLPADSLQHIWSPELHRIDGKWYLYFEADDGNTDNHQLYVMENASDDPMEGTFRMKGAIKTNEEWNFGLHPTSIVVRGKQYLLWSGWQHRRSETETQCIYIARMLNPWTLDSERVLLSKPELEWERQWINPNGDRSNYPIFVNENPEAFITPDQHYVCVCYSASGIWTVYNTLGMLYARADADLLDIRSWTKMQEPVVRCMPDSTIFGISDICVVPSVDGQHHYLLYEAKQYDDEGFFHRNIQMRPLGWNDEGLPRF